MCKIEVIRGREDSPKPLRQVVFKVVSISRHGAMVEAKVIDPLTDNVLNNFSRECLFHGDNLTVTLYDK